MEQWQGFFSMPYLAKEQAIYEIVPAQALLIVYGKPMLVPLR